MPRASSPTGSQKIIHLFLIKTKRKNGGDQVAVGKNCKFAKMLWTFNNI